MCIYIFKMHTFILRIYIHGIQLQEQRYHISGIAVPIYWNGGAILAGFFIIDEYPVLGGKVLDEPVDILTCAIEYRFEESIHIQKDIAISNLETWLEEKDPQSCRAILTLAGF